MVGIDNRHIDLQVNLGDKIGLENMKNFQWSKSTFSHLQMQGVGPIEIFRSSTWDVPESLVQFSLEINSQEE